jgi:hypothetical protein
MKNLKKFNVCELNTEELISNEGGYIWWGGLWKTYSSIGYFDSDSGSEIRISC